MFDPYVHAGKRDALLAYLAETSVPEGVRRVIVECFEKGWVKGGPRMFYVVLEKRGAPEENGQGRPSRKEKCGPFWGNGSARRELTRNVLHACLCAGFLYILEGDTPKRSIMGAVMDEARCRSIQNFGGQGTSAAIHTVALSKGFVEGWVAGDATISSKILAFSTLNEDICVGQKTFRAIRSKNGLALAQQTRLGQLCMSGKGVSVGSETSVVTRDGEKYGGSDLSSFAVQAGHHTPPHLDTSQVCGGDWTDAFACAIIAPVQRVWTGPSKRAVLVSRQDRASVVRLLQLDVKKPPVDQCKRKDIKVLSDLVTVLQEGRIGYVVVDFPRLCSYVIPPGCVHMFFTIGLTETTTWFPTLHVVDPA